MTGSGRTGGTNPIGNSPQPHSTPHLEPKRKPGKRLAGASNRRQPARLRQFESLESKSLLTGTPHLIEINPTGASAPSDFLQIGDITYFVVDDGAHGRELWRTDGTAAGTTLVKDIQAGSVSATPTALTNLNGVLYFSANDGVNGEELWKSDGTAAGTVLVRDIQAGSASSTPREVTAYNGAIYFSAQDANGTELWRSDGTAAGTTLVNDLFPGTSNAQPNSSTPRHFAVASGSLYFSALGSDGLELWKSDGTTSGTTQVKDIYTGTYTYYDYGVYPNSANPTQLMGVNGTLFFAATDQSNGTELWKSDGTAAGTVLVKDIHTGSTDQQGYGTIGNPSSPHLLTSLNGILYFVADDGVSGPELWKSDGTAAGTTLVADILPGTTGGMSATASIVVVGGTLYFAASDGVHGVELWKSDGTAAGTQQVGDLEAGATGSSPASLTALGGLLYFAATTTSAGAELWQSDGTSTGTHLVADTIAGATGIAPTTLGSSSAGLLFSGDSGSNRELYTLADSQDTAGSVNLSIYVNGQQVTIPANVGVSGDGTKAATYTSDASGKVYFDSSGGALSLGSFFSIWRTGGGLAGNNASATFSATQLLGNVVDRTHSLQMFVNGHLSTAADTLALHDGDQIALVYGVDPVVSLNTNFGSILVDLYGTQTPGTVANFLDYVNSGAYVNSFFHRSVNDFVIQGGGFTTTSPTFSTTNQFAEIPTNLPITNEPGISNLRGTIAMAKLGGDPNSATSQFFVNLSDTNTFLDSAANNAFTVFGKILGMTTVDAIAALPINTSNASPYDELPLSSANQLAVIQSIEGQGTIAGVEYSDSNSNGTFDAGDVAIVGATIYLDANGNGALDSGEVATTTAADGSYFFHVPSGVYTVRSLGVSGNTTATPASHSATVEIGGETTGLNFSQLALTAPTAVVLAAASDTGTAGDSITRLNNGNSASTLQFTVSGVSSGAQVYVYAGETLLGSATAAGSDVTVVTLGNAALADGQVATTAVQSLSGVQSSASTPLSITIDATEPAAFTSTPPQVAQVGQTLSYDANSPDETLPGMTYSLVDAPTGMTIDASGLITWTPTADQDVPQHVQIKLSDAAGNQIVQEMNLTVLAAIPAYPDPYSTNEDTPLVVDAATGLLANDGNATSGALTAALVAGPAHGTVTLNSDGSFTYTPTANFAGSDQFTYIATNGVDQTNVAEVTITVVAQNDAPVGVGDSYATNEDVPLTIAAAGGVLANDSDVDGNTLTAQVASGPSHGTLTLNSDGSFVYTPESQYSGEDSFTYTLSDGTTSTDPVTVLLQIAAVDDPPIAVADSYSVNEDSSLTIAPAAGVLANDTDADSTALTALLVSSPAHGTLTLAADGSFAYTPSTNFFGTDSFTYTVSDGVSTSQSMTATITVVGQPDPPLAANDSATAPNDGTVQAINVLANDTSEPDGTQTLTITSVTQGTSGGTVSISGSSINYTGPVGFTGTDTFTYTTQDTDGLTSTATVTVAVADARVSSIGGYVYIDSNSSGTRDGSESGVPGVMVTLTGTDNQGVAVNRTAITDAIGAYKFDNLKAGTYQLAQHQPQAMLDGAESTGVAGAVVGSDTISNIVLTGGVDLTENNFGEKGLLPQYISVLWFLASTPTDTSLLRSSIARGEELAGNAELATAIRAGYTTMPSTANTPPVAVNDSYAATQNVTLTVSAAGGVLANDTDADGNGKTATVATAPTHGTLTLNADGSFSYVPTSGYVGADSFTYQVSDGQASATGTVSINVSAAANTAPVAVGDSYSVTHDGSLVTSASTGVLANDTDVDGSNLSASVVSAPQHGTLNLASDGSFTYIPTSGYNGTDSFTYQASDGQTSANATVSITVSATNTAPVAIGDAYTTDEDTPLEIDASAGLLANDSDANSDALSVTILAQPEHGVLGLASDGSFTYTPAANYFGSDSFSYTLGDGVASATGSVTLTINPVNDAPLAVADTYELSQDETLAISAALGLLANDSDIDGDMLMVSLESEPTGGTLTVEDDGSFTYLPEAGFAGSDSFTYRVSDGYTTSTPITVDLNVNSLTASASSLLADLALANEEDWLF